MDKPLVSIIIPVYNGENYISETIESAINQSWVNKEIIVIDDGSTDNSLIAAKKFENEWIRVVSQPNRGASAARNLGLKLSKGDYIQFLDSDDFLSNDKIEKQIEILQNFNGRSLIGCRWTRFKGSINHTVGAMNPPVEIAMNLTPLEWLIRRKTMVLHAWLTPKALMVDAGLWDESLTYNDDGEFFFRVIAQAEQVLYCEEPCAYYRTENHGTNISYLNSKEKYYSAYYAALSYKNVLSCLSISSESQRAIGNYFKELLYLYYGEFPDLVKMCRSHPELELSNVAWETGGITKRMVSVLGWKITKLIKTLWLTKGSIRLIF